ncbi:MAG: hypothetical protein K0R62_5029 [Nonomuraea muscovyensis]|nr:hypothetical protein [Nonomuraea muscovyensis]
MAKWTRSGLGVTVLAVLAAGCGVVLPQAQPSPSATPARVRSSAAPSSTPPGEHVAATSTATSTPTSTATAGDVALKAPADPCRVLSSRTRLRIRMPKATRDRRDVACAWTNEPGTAPPFVLRDLKISYTTGLAGLAFTEEEARMTFATRRRNDYRQPSVFGGAPSVKGVIRQVGTARSGEHFDEGYYVYYVYQVAAARRGEGRAVLRKGNVVVSITASGADIPTRRVRDGRPAGNATVQTLIDAVAPQALAAVR